MNRINEKKNVIKHGLCKIPVFFQRWNKHFRSEQKKIGQICNCVIFTQEYAILVMIKQSSIAVNKHITHNYIRDTI